MWMNPYVQDVLIREQIADAQQRAARNHLLRRARPRRAPGGAWKRLRHHACAIFRLTPSQETLSGETEALEVSTTDTIAVRDGQTFGRDVIRGTDSVAGGALADVVANH